MTVFLGNMSHMFIFVSYLFFWDLLRVITVQAILKHADASKRSAPWGKPWQILTVLMEFQALRAKFCGRRKVRQRIERKKSIEIAWIKKNGALNFVYNAFNISKWWYNAIHARTAFEIMKTQLRWHLHHWGDRWPWNMTPNPRFAHTQTTSLIIGWMKTLTQRFWLWVFMIYRVLI